MEPQILPGIESGALDADEMADVVAALRSREADGTCERASGRAGERASGRAGERASGQETWSSAAGQFDL